MLPLGALVVGSAVLLGGGTTAAQAVAVPMTAWEAPIPTPVATTVTSPAPSATASSQPAETATATPSPSASPSVRAASVRASATPSPLRSARPRVSAQVSARPTAVPSATPRPPDTISQQWKPTVGTGSSQAPVPVAVTPAAATSSDLINTVVIFAVLAAVLLGAGGSLGLYLTRPRR